MRDWSDENIWNGLRDGALRQEAFRALRARYESGLLGFMINKCVGDRHRAEDLLGPVLIKAYKGLAKMPRRCASLKSWLFTVAANHVVDEARKANKEPDLLS